MHACDQYFDSFQNSTISIDVTICLYLKPNQRNVSQYAVFGVYIVAATQQNKNLLFTISTANVKDEIPLPWKMLQEVNCGFGIL